MSKYLSNLVDEYYEGNYSKSHKWNLFRREMRKKFGYHLDLDKRLKRKGYRRRRPLTPEMIELIAKRLDG